MQDQQIIFSQERTVNYLARRVKSQQQIIDCQKRKINELNNRSFLNARRDAAAKRRVEAASSQSLSGMPVTTFEDFCKKHQDKLQTLQWDAI